MNEEEKIEEEKIGVTLPPETEAEAPELNNAPEPIIEEPAIEEPEAAMTPEQVSVEKLFTQKDMDELAGKVRAETREKSLKDLLETLGASDMDSLKVLIGDGQRFPMLQEEMQKNCDLAAADKKSSEERIAKLEKDLGDLNSELILYKSDVDPNRYEDVKLILKGKGLDINTENIMNEMATHPEWEKKAPVAELPPAPVEPEEPVSTISRLGNGKTEEPANNERSDAMSLFDIK